ncbi:MAG: flagellar biosynthesis protein FlhF [Alkalispirochaeta sp.]
MDYFVEQGANDQEVQTIIRRKYGERARILSRKEVRSGGVLGLFRRRAVEVTGYCSHAPQPQRSAPRGSMHEERRKILDTVRPPLQEPPARAFSGGGSGSGASGSGASGGNAASPQGQENSADSRQADVGSGIEQQSNSRRDPSGSGGLDAVLSEIRSLRERMDSTEKSGGEPAGVQRVREILEDNDFSNRYIREVISRLRTDCTMDELDDAQGILKKVGDWIEKSIQVYPWQERRKRPHIFVLVGPTGVGKTTTIAKLAAMYGAVADPSYDVRILTIDSYRIGALQQIQKYGEIMNIPVHPVETAGDMRKHLDLHDDADFIFVDTIGKSPNDVTKLAEVNQLVRSAGGEVHLAVSATTKRSDIADILRQFEPFNYQAVVVTKLDETSSVGGIISALHEKQKSVSFITDGQSVPQDIERAKKETFLARLRDLPARREPAHALTKE